MSAISDSSGLEVVILPGLTIYCSPLSLSCSAERSQTGDCLSALSHHPPLYNAYSQPASQTVVVERELVYRSVLCQPG